MTKRSSSFQRDLLNATLKALIVLLLFKGCDSTLSNIDLSTTTLNPATTGFMMTGNDANDYFGASVRTAGDINNDGYADIIVGASEKNSYKGAVYVIYGGPTTSISNIDLSKIALDPATTGFMITGNATNDHFGYSASTAGDINHDGYDDIIVGAYGKKFQKLSYGAAYVIYGGPKSSMSNIDLSTTALDPATTGFTITGSVLNNVGYSVSAAGDINRDGYSDIIVGSPFQGLALDGVAYVIYGGPKSSMPNINLGQTKLDPATTGFMITGNVFHGNFGYSVSRAGDIDNDGYDDIIIGTSPYSGLGKAYVIYGGPKSSMSNIDLSTSVLNPLSTGFMITGNVTNDLFGSSVSRAGDINRDGYDDIIIGAYEQTNYQGAAYVVYGGPRSSMSNINLTMTTLDPATTGFIITGSAANEWFGFSVATAGDIDNDGFDDIIVDAALKSTNRGVVYLIYGGPKSSMSNIDLSSTTLAPATTGFIITGNAVEDHLGMSLSTAGDINHDGYGDIIVGAQSKNQNQGAAYVIYGGPRSSMSSINI